MPDSETALSMNSVGAEVLTLPEVAAYLRVPEVAVLDLVTKNALPAQNICGEWRFLKRAVAEWLRFGPHIYHEFRRFPPPWVLGHPFWEDLFQELEERILNRLPAPESPAEKRGSRQAVLRHFGVFQEDADLEVQLAGIRTPREAAGG